MSNFAYNLGKQLADEPFEKAAQGWQGAASQGLRAGGRWLSSKLAPQAVRSAVNVGRQAAGEGAGRSVARGISAGTEHGARSVGRTAEPWLKALHGRVKAWPSSLIPRGTQAAYAQNVARLPANTRFGGLRRRAADWLGQNTSRYAGWAPRAAVGWGARHPMLSYAGAGLAGGLPESASQAYWWGANPLYNLGSMAAKKTGLVDENSPMWQQVLASGGDIPFLETGGPSPVAEAFRGGEKQPYYAEEGAPTPDARGQMRQLAMEMMPYIMQQGGGYTPPTPNWTGSLFNPMGPRMPTASGQGGWNDFLQSLASAAQNEGYRTRGTSNRNPFTGLPPNTVMPSLLGQIARQQTGYA